jgi:hypothetical protein
MVFSSKSKTIQINSFMKFKISHCIDSYREIKRDKPQTLLVIFKHLTIRFNNQRNTNLWRHDIQNDVIRDNGKQHKGLSRDIQHSNNVPLS